jgi:hypothetical protein
MHPLMSNTKWDELRLAMYRLGQTQGKLAPRWRTLCVESGYLSPWDREWFYHFRNGAYKSIQWVEIAADTDEQREEILAELIKIHVPGECTEFGFRIFGYVESNVAVSYIESAT